MEKKLRVLIADDHSLFRDGMRGLLATQPDMEVVGEATTGEEAVRLVGELQPDVVLMDVKMPGGGGIEATRRLLAKNPGVRVLVVTMFEDDATVFTAMRAGARGYVLKDDDKDDVLGAIRTVGRGGLRPRRRREAHGLAHHRPSGSPQGELPRPHRARTRDAAPDSEGGFQRRDLAPPRVEP